MAGKYRAVKRVSEQLDASSLGFSHDGVRDTANFYSTRTSDAWGFLNNEVGSVYFGGYGGKELSFGAGNYSDFDGLAYSITSRLYIRIPKSEIAEPISTLKIAQWLDDNKVVVIHKLQNPITIPEPDFSEYGIEVDGLLTSNNEYTEFYTDNYDLFSPTEISYSTNLAKAVENNKEALQGLRSFASNQNLINLEFDLRISLLE